ncbi:hypothetical protein HDU98_004564, partial [Podochytrium sp. JEL0797]
MATTWTVLAKEVPRIFAELPVDRVAELLKTTSASLAKSDSDALFEPKLVASPQHGAAFVARIATDSPPHDGWGWLDNEAFKEHEVAPGVALREWTHALGFASTDSHAVITRKRFALSTKPDLQFVHYLNIKDSLPKVAVTKDAIKVEPLSATPAKRKVDDFLYSSFRSTSLTLLHLKQSPATRSEDEAWGFEDQSVPALISVARYKRNHDLINELFSPIPP